MTTWTEHLAAQDRQWAIIVRIEGVGPYLSNADLTASGNDARYRFCVDTPAYASSQPSTLRREYLADPLPNILAEQVDIFGGFPQLGTIQFSIVDYDDFLSELLRTESTPVTIADEAIDSSETAIDVGSGSSVTNLSVIYIGGEAMRVTAIAANTLTVSRGYLSTDAVSHQQNDRVRQYIPNLLGRRVQVHVAPLQGESTSDEQLVGEYVIDGHSWDKALNTHNFRGRSQLKYLDRALPRKRRAAKIVAIHPGNYIEVQPVEGDDVLAWNHWSGNQVDASATPARFFVKTGEEIIACIAAFRTLLRVSRREVLGSPNRGDLRIGDTLTNVFVADKNEPAASFRYVPGASPTTDLTSANWVKTDNWVDIILCLMTSPSTTFDNFVSGGNPHNSYGNWSSLPVGYGLGIPTSVIDVGSFVAVKNRTREYIFPNFVYGEEKNGSAARLITENFLRVMGAYFSLESGLIKLILPRTPLLSEAVTSLGVNDILADEVSPGVLQPAIDVSVNTELHASGVTYVVGPEKTDISFTSGEFGDTYGQRGSYVSDDKSVIISVPGGSRLLASLYGDRAQARLFRLHKPNIEVQADVDAGSSWAAVVGSLVSVTLGDMPNRVTGVRGWTSVVAEVIQREIQFDEQRGVFAKLGLITYSQRIRVGRITPSAMVSSVSGNTATVLANRYTSSDATGGLPTTDASAFTPDTIVRLVNRSGADIGGGDEQVFGVSGDDITLSSNFGGALVAGTILVLAPYDDADASDRELYAFAADLDTQTVDASNQSAYIYGES